MAIASSAASIIPKAGINLVLLEPGVGYLETVYIVLRTPCLRDNRYAHVDMEDITGPSNTFAAEWRGLGAIIRRFVLSTEVVTTVRVRTTNHLYCTVRTKADGSSCIVAAVS